MTRPVPLSRLERQATIQSHASRLSAAAGARNGAVLAVAPAADAEGTTTAELWLYGVVGGYYWGFNDKTVADQLRGLDVDQVFVRINSPGGDSIQGIAIGNLFRNHKARFVGVVDGLAASAASILALGCDELVMSPGSQMMIHDPWFFTMGNAKELRQDADFLDKQGANMAGVYASRAGGTPETWRAAMTAEPDGTWYTADEAVAAKLADRVGTVVAVGAAPEPPAVDLDDEDDDVAARAAWDLEVLITPAARSAWSSITPAIAGPKTPEGAPAPGPATTTQEGGAAVAEISDEQLTIMRQQLGVSADADLATCLAALPEALAENAEDPPGPTAAAPVLPEGVVAIDATVLQGLQAGAATAAELARAEAERVKTSAITAALAAGKITAASKATWETEWDKAPGVTAALLSSLPAGAVPVSELGSDDQSVSAQADAVPAAAAATLAAAFGLSEEVYA